MGLLGDLGKIAGGVLGGPLGGNLGGALGGLLGTGLAEADPIARLLSLRSRVLRARQQATLLKKDLPMFGTELTDLELDLIECWRTVSDIIDVVMPEGANDTPEEIVAEQKRIASELRSMAQAGALKGLEDPDV